MPSSLGVATYRIVQEGLTNVIKHAHASHASVQVQIADDLTIVVSDDGVGGNAKPGRGLGGIRERAELHGGHVVHGPGAMGGFEVRCTLPLIEVDVIRVAIVDDDALIREGLRMIVEQAGDLEVVATAGDGEEALRVAREHRPDVMLMDVRMPILDGIEATRQITETEGAPRVIILTTFELDEYVFEALRAGASGFLLKRTEPEQLVAAIRVVAGGEALLSPSVTKRLIEEFTRRPQSATGPASSSADRLTVLTEREREVLLLIARGLSNQELAEQLFIADNTVKTHVKRIFTKLGARDRAQAIVIAYESGLVP